ncbi:Uncharacterized protein SCF082_LOCUS26982 [Durusdinium trenchii]|uniref:DUF4246 domain-containing protein n=1 Tax=Durusdinium trenchii TaxID=1381693 RepID=A0ABP0MAC2_9DINO
MSEQATGSGPAAHALRLVLPEVLSFLPHTEARALSAVSKEWLAANAKVRQVVPELHSLKFIRAFLETMVALEEPFQDDTVLCIEWKRNEGFVLLVKGEDFNRVCRAPSGGAAELQGRLQVPRDVVEKQHVEPGQDIIITIGDQPMDDPRLGWVDDNLHVHVDTIKGTLLGEHNGKMELQVRLVYVTHDGNIGGGDHFHDLRVSVFENPRQKRLLEVVQTGPVREGVVWNDVVVPEELITSLTNKINVLQMGMEPDVHPGSEGKVLDNVHPSLQAYVHGVSVLGPDPTGKFQPNDNRKDRFGREYEVGSKFQWLPTALDIRKDGSVEIFQEISGLPLTDDTAPLYEDLEELFARFVPRLEAVISYARFVRFAESFDPYSEPPRRSLARVSLKQGVPHPSSPPDAYMVPDDCFQWSTLCVVPKIVDYVLQPGQSHEGVWHLEGMAQEHIIATCLFIVDRDECIAGGELQFKRSFVEEERECFKYCSDQQYDEGSIKFLRDGFRPLGSVATPKGRMIVFPNTHVHKVSKMVNTGSAPAKRRIIVFFVMDPELVHHPLTTMDLAPEQPISLDQAKQFRLELMEERKTEKGRLNPRRINLCEH